MTPISNALSRAKTACLQKLELSSSQKELLLKISQAAVRGLFGFAVTFLAAACLPCAIQPVFVPLISMGAFLSAAFFYKDCSSAASAASN